ncbi:MAG: penicillin acylase family protein [Gammaproteobacteria bacterium]
MRQHVFLLLLSASLIGCSADVGDRYNVEIRWTSYGIPQVKADDWGSLGYGFAYATATDGVCVFAREVARANGTLTADMGATPENIGSDAHTRSSTAARTRVAKRTSGVANRRPGNRPE